MKSDGSATAAVVMRKPGQRKQKLVGSLQSFEGRGYERSQMPAVHKFEWDLADGVVAAGQCDDFEVDSMLPEQTHHLLREFAQEGEVVLGIDHQHLLRMSGKLLHVRDWTDGRPELPKSLK